VTNGQQVFVVVKRTQRMASVVEGHYLATYSEAGNDVVTWVNDSGLVSFAKREDVFEDESLAVKRQAVVEGRT
jgi:hypothetical protein